MIWSTQSLRCGGGSAGGATGTKNAQDDLLLIVRRVEALGQFLDSEDGKNLLAGYKRATNIIRIEEKKDNRHYTGAPQSRLYRQPEERALANAIETAETEAARAVKKEDFVAAMRAMAKLRPDVDAFFDKVTVNVDDKAVARKSAQASQSDSRGDPHGGRFLEDRGVICHSGARPRNDGWNVANCAGSQMPAPC